jgi:phosphohistidine phosphatase
VLLDNRISKKGNTVKTLYIVRHAKSSWDHDGISDFERPLNKRGHHDAPMMGAVLVGHGARPHLIRSSAAERAIHTARLLAGALSCSEEDIVADEGMYGAGPLELVDVIAGFPEDAREAMVVGHNPTMFMLAYRLGGFDAENLPTCGIVCIDFEMESWKDVRNVRGRIRYFEYPKKHR